MQTLALSGQINSVDAQGGGTIQVVNVDLRQQPNAGGVLNAEASSTAVAAGSITVGGQLSIIDTEGGGTINVVNVDLRQQPNAGGFFEAEVASSALAYAGASAPSAPTLGTASSGTQGSRTEYFKVTYVDANGNESLPSAEANEVVGANLVATVTSPSASTGAVKYNVYGATSTGNEKLQNATPIALGTPWQEPAGGLTTTGRAVPTASAFVAGACNVTVSQGGALAAGACTVTVTQ